MKHLSPPGPMCLALPRPQWSSPQQDCQRCWTPQRCRWSRCFRGCFGRRPRNLRSSIARQRYPNVVCSRSAHVMPFGVPICETSSPQAYHKVIPYQSLIHVVERSKHRLHRSLANLSLLELSFRPEHERRRAHCAIAWRYPATKRCKNGRPSAAMRSSEALALATAQKLSARD